MQQQLMQQQQQQQHQPMMQFGFNPTNITTDHIQRYLDENKSLILKILENQNSGKVSECAENQAKLQQNLMYLAAIADCQPQPASVYAQQQQQQLSQHMIPTQQMLARSPVLYAQQHQPYPSLQQQQVLHYQPGSIYAATGGHHHMLQRSNDAEDFQGTSKQSGTASKQDADKAEDLS